MTNDIYRVENFQSWSELIIFIENYSKFENGQSGYFVARKHGLEVEI